VVQVTDLLIRVAIAAVVLWYLMPEDEQAASGLAALQWRIHAYRTIAEWSGKRALKLEVKYNTAIERGRMI
jgi:hypothetical protein